MSDINKFKKAVSKLDGELSGEFDSEDMKYEDINLSGIKGIQANKEITLTELTGKRNLYALLGLLIFNAIMASYQIYQNESDDIAISYSLPDQRDMDAPVLLREAHKGTLKDADNLIRGFVRQYIRARYPKNSKELMLMYTFVKNHSTGNIRNDFASRIDRIEDIANKIDGGMTTTIYPKSSDNLKIRKNTLSNSWIVEFDGRYVTDIGTDESARAYVKVRMEIEQGSQSISKSPSGFYVTDYKVTYLKDGVTNEIEEVGI